MRGAQVLRHGLIHLLDGQRCCVRGLEQAPDAPSVGLDLPGGDRVVGLDLKVEDCSSWPVARSMARAGIKREGNNQSEANAPARQVRQYSRRSASSSAVSSA
jgi:hypothetical protein